MKPTNIKPNAGSILISEPSLKDMYFNRAVVLIADHNSDGSFGIILNKPLDVQLNDIVKGFPEFDARVYLGGPVSTKNLFFLHKKGDLIRNSTLIKEDLFWGGEIDDVKSLIDLGVLQKEDIRFYIGYSGWTENQLDEELKEFSWLVDNPEIQELISVPTSEMWKKSVSRLGKDYELWANFPNDPSLN
ncbi:MAG: YqgE/AlgH family protein [Bacteroidales bacterium]|nr:YqgE/AlgH family protein [Bacteroidales bacterium]